MDDNTGVLYGIFGLRHWERLCVSVFSLRKSGYAGLICIQSHDGPSDEIAARLTDVVGLGPIVHQSVRFKTPIITRDDGYAAKTEMVKVGPFARGVFLDCDTTVAGPFFDDLLPRENEQAVLTSFAQWNAMSGRVKKRIERWRGIAPTAVGQALNPSWPAINTGVYGFVRGTKFFTRWESLAFAGLLHGAGFICDEIAAQLLLSEFIDLESLQPPPVRIACSIYNHSPQFPTYNGTDVRIWHYHGGKHLKTDLGRTTWLPLYKEAYEANVAGLREWGAQY